MQTTMESRKRKVTDTPATTPTKRIIKRPATTSRAPTVASTRATAARAAAIRSQSNSSTTTTMKRPRPIHHQQKANTNGDTKSNNNNATKQQRPHWDIRGRIRDMEERLQQDQEKSMLGLSYITSCILIDTTQQLLNWKSIGMD